MTTLQGFIVGFASGFSLLAAFVTWRLRKLILL
jgi:hypothetical protein